MARELQLKDSNALVKVRSPWAVALLPFITLGIYHLVWWYRINREMRDYGRAHGYDLGLNPTNSLLALFPGSLVVVPPLVSYWRGTKRVQGAARIAGHEPVNGWIALVLFVVISPAYWAYLQVSLNHVWLADAAALAGEAPLVEPSPMPPRLPDDTETAVVKETTVAPEAPTQAPSATPDSQDHPGVTVKEVGESESRRDRGEPA